MPSEESFSPEDEAFFEAASSAAADSVRPVTLDGHAALTEEDDTGALPHTPHPGRFVRPVQRVVAVLAAISMAALAREALRSPADELAAAPAQLTSNAAPAELAANPTPAFHVEALADDVACSLPLVESTSDDSSASAPLEANVAFIGPPAPPAPPTSRSTAPLPAPRLTAHGKPHVKVATTTPRTAPRQSPARTKGVSTAALLHAVRAHAKVAPRK